MLANFVHCLFMNMSSDHGKSTNFASPHVVGRDVGRRPRVPAPSAPQNMQPHFRGVLVKYRAEILTLRPLEPHAHFIPKRFDLPFHFDPSSWSPEGRGTPCPVSAAPHPHPRRYPPCPCDGAWSGAYGRRSHVLEIRPPDGATASSPPRRNWCHIKCCSKH